MGQADLLAAIDARNSLEFLARMIRYMLAMLEIADGPSPGPRG